jgi:hypothetical protein
MFGFGANGKMVLEIGIALVYDTDSLLGLFPYLFLLDSPALID